MTKVETATTAWTRCDFCDDVWCNIHECHAYECDCPKLDGWMDCGVDPYLEYPSEARLALVMSWEDPDEED